MKRSILFSSLLVLFGTAHAELQTLDNQQLQQVEGQAGATINWTLSLNQTSPGVSDTTTCSDLRFCRFAVSSNNRYDDGSYVSNDGTIHKKNGDVTTATGRKQWLVFKGLQGTIQIQNMDISGDDLKYTADSTDEKIKAALKVSFKKEYPILIRNLGLAHFRLKPIPLPMRVQVMYQVISTLTNMALQQVQTLKLQIRFMTKVGKQVLQE